MLRKVAFRRASCVTIRIVCMIRNCLCICVRECECDCALVALVSFSSVTIGEQVCVSSNIVCAEHAAFC